MARIVTLPPEAGLTSDGAKIGGWWEAAEADSGRLLCKLCPRGCTLGPGGRGLCFVRENRGGQMISSTYGRSTGFCIDPIEKKPLNHFYPGSSVLSFGTAGCNLGCKFCQNWTTTKSRDVEAACEVAMPKAIAEAARQLECRSVAFTYNDPIVWTEYAIDTAKACHALGIKTVAVTSGYMNPAPREALYEHIDAVNVDLKGFTEDFYREMTDGHLVPVLDTLRWLADHPTVWLEITNLIVPGANDSPEGIEQMCRWILGELGPEIPLHFSAFHPDFEMTDRPPTSPETLIMAHDVAKSVGLRCVYTGNVSDKVRQATYCPACGERVIGRDGFRVDHYSIRDGRCGKCGGPIAGRFDDTAGGWSGGRRPIRIADYAPVAAEPCPSCAATTAIPEAVPDEAMAGPQLTQEQDKRLLQAVSRRVGGCRSVATDGPVDRIAAGRCRQRSRVRRVRHTETRRPASFVLRIHRPDGAACRRPGPCGSSRGQGRSEIPAHLADRT